MQLKREYAIGCILISFFFLMAEMTGLGSNGGAVKVSAIVDGKDCSHCEPVMEGMNSVGSENEHLGWKINCQS